MELEIDCLHIARIGGLDLADPIYAERKPTVIGDFNENGFGDLMVKFDRQALQEQLSDQDGVVEIAVGGTLEDGKAISGIDAVRVIHREIEGFAVTGVQITWDGVAMENHLHLDSYEIHGLAQLLEHRTVEDLTWDVHFLLALSENSLVY